MSCTITAEQTLADGLEISATAIGGGAEAVRLYSMTLGQSLVYTDRDYTFTSLADYDPNCFFLRGPNSDKNTASSQAGFTCTLCQWPRQSVMLSLTSSGLQGCFLLMSYWVLLLCGHVE